MTARARRRNRGRAKTKEAPPPTQTAWLYLRVSTKEQAERDTSLPNQRRALLDYAERNGIEVLEEFEEPGASAKDDNRPVFRQMMGRLLTAEAKVDVVLCWMTSRFMRNSLKAKLYKEKLRKRGIRVVAICQETTDDPAGHLMEGMFEMVDQYESEMTGLRAAAGMRERARQGYFPGSRAPLGFRVERVMLDAKNRRNRIVPEPAEVEIHNEMFRVYVVVRGAKATARELNSRGLLYRGKLWDKGKVLKVLDEEAAIGTYFWGKRDKHRRLRDESEWVPIPVEPIIDRELFELAQQVREANDPVKSPGRTASSPLLLAGLVKCGKCGASYTMEGSGKKTSTKTYGYRYYNCRTFLRIGADACGGHRIPEEKLDRAVLEHLASKVFTLDASRQILRDLAEETGALRSKTADQRLRLKDELEEVERAIRKWESAFEDGFMDPKLGARRLAELAERRKEISGALAVVVPIRPPPHLYTEPTIKRFQAKLRELLLSEDTSVARGYLTLLVDAIVVEGSTVRLVAKTEGALRLLATGGATVGELTASAVSPTTVMPWLRRRGSNSRPGG